MPSLARWNFTHDQGIIIKGTQVPGDTRYEVMNPTPPPGQFFNFKITMLELIFAELLAGGSLFLPNVVKTKHQICSVEFRIFRSKTSKYLDSSFETEQSSLCNFIC